MAARGETFVPSSRGTTVGGRNDGGRFTFFFSILDYFFGGGPDHFRINAREEIDEREQRDRRERERRARAEAEGKVFVPTIAGPPVASTDVGRFPRPGGFRPYGYGVASSVITFDWLRGELERRRRQKAEEDRTRDELRAPPVDRPTIPGVDRPNPRPRPVREPGAGRPDRPVRPAPPVALPGPKLPGTGAGASGMGARMRQVIDNMVFSETVGPPRLPRVEAPPPEIPEISREIFENEIPAAIFFPEKIIPAPIFFPEIPAPVPAKIDFPSIPLPRLPLPTRAAPNLLVPGLIVGTGIVTALSRSQSRARDLGRLANPSGLTPFQQPVPTLANPATANAPFNRAATGQCEIVKRRRRRKGKCREGFFAEYPGETKYETWRTVDCRTRKAKGTGRPVGRPRKNFTIEE